MVGESLQQEELVVLGLGGVFYLNPPHLTWRMDSSRSAGPYLIAPVW